MENRLTVYKVIGAKVAYYRKLNCYSQYDLAEKLSVSRSVIAKIESGKYNDNIQLNMLFSLAKALHVEASKLTAFAFLLCRSVTSSNGIWNTWEAVIR